MILFQLLDHYTNTCPGTSPRLYTWSVIERDIYISLNKNEILIKRIQFA